MVSIVRRAITKWGVIQKNPIFLSQYWIHEEFDELSSHLDIHVIKKGGDIIQQLSHNLKK